jgi:predicted double-glycine peptidase
MYEVHAEINDNKHFLILTDFSADYNTFNTEELLTLWSCIKITDVIT